MGKFKRGEMVMVIDETSKYYRQNFVVSNYCEKTAEYSLETVDGYGLVSTYYDFQLAGNDF